MTTLVVGFLSIVVLLVRGFLVWFIWPLAFGVFDVPRPGFLACAGMAFIADCLWVNAWTAWRDK